MEWFGITQYGPQNYIKDVVREDYHEPRNHMHPEDGKKCVEHALATSTCPREFRRPTTDSFPYGSYLKFKENKEKGIMKILGPTDIYRMPPTTSFEHGWFLCDTALSGKDWYKTCPRYPQPMSPNTRILDTALMNNKYASLY